LADTYPPQVRRSVGPSATTIQQTGQMSAGWTGNERWKSFGHVVVAMPQAVALLPMRLACAVEAGQSTVAPCTDRGLTV
jgi:hypothetical protein